MIKIAQKQTLYWLLLLKAVIAFIIIANYQVGLSPDEAQYWTWSQALDWGYYSKPPGIAWQIGLTTALFGNSELGVRFGAIVIAFVLALVVGKMALWAKRTQLVSYWAAMVMAFCPLGVYLSLAATTDGGAILFLTLAVAYVVKGLEEESGPNYLLIGLFVALGALFKWTAFSLWLFVLVGCIFSPRMRKRSVWIGFGISLLAFLPTLYWNASHDWATFKHVGSTLYKSTSSQHGNFFDFLGAQIGLFSPMFFLMWLYSYRHLFTKKRPGLWFCVLVPTVALIYFIAAFSKKMQPNWAAYLYPPAMVLVGWVGVKWGTVWLKIGTWLAIAICVVGISIPYIQSHNLSPLLPISYKANPFRQSAGVQNLTGVLETVGYNPESDVLIGDKYQVASLLSFYSPGQKRAYFLNVHHQRKNQFSYWPSLIEGQSGYFAVIENKKADALGWYETHYLEVLAPYFQTVKYVGAFPLFTAYGEGVKYAIIFQVSDFLGVSPEDPLKW